MNLAGSYAQLTLLGQPKVNPTSIQKILPSDNQNGPVPPLRANSTTSTNSVQNTFDTKKAKETYEKLVKQLEV